MRSTYPGGVYATTFAKMQARFPTRALEIAVKGMLPKGPLGYAMLGSGIVYFLISGRDMGLVASQSLNGLYGDFVMLAVPLFIFAAELMNAGEMTDKGSINQRAVLARRADLVTDLYAAEPSPRVLVIAKGA